MNIKQAKDQIKNAMTAYFTKDEFGAYAIPPEEQRPVFLMGPPGIGKTAIMKQIAQEMGVGLLSYSMTHHTRQSALGLPFIVHKTYAGQEFDVSEYTMSEIISSVYELMETTGVKEGILFLDEINCVSETLSPVMLQFLQYKVFGRHRVPDGWIVVTAGNPPEYNNSVREFDIVTWDRLKRIDVEPDYEVWKEYAYQKGVHPAILTYLDIKKADFYKVESSVSGKRFVTARGWDDLSTMLRLYEQNGLTADEKLVSQYLQDPKIAKEFAVYYDLFNKYRSDYQIDAILAGKAPENIVQRAKEAKFDERLSLLGLILDGVTDKLRDVVESEGVQMKLLTALKTVRLRLAKPGVTARAALDEELRAQEDALKKGQTAGTVSREEERIVRRLTERLTALWAKTAADAAGQEAFAPLKKAFDAATADLKKQAESAGKNLSNAFKFLEDAFGEGQELLIFVTELTISYHCARFISRYGCEEYFAHNKELLFYERQQEIITQLEELSWENL